MGRSCSIQTRCRYQPVVPSDGSGNRAATVSFPEDGDWGHEPLEEEGFTYERAFETDGEYDSYCRPHESAGMVGTVVGYGAKSAQGHRRSQSDPATNSCSILIHSVSRRERRSLSPESLAATTSPSRASPTVRTGKASSGFCRPASSTDGHSTYPERTSTTSNHTRLPGWSANSK
ncbi:hypothetical protein BRC68_15005 [Halobacteriales archaeon QH_6_64_20]|nr:MAG: hypothetical protein BRC68_15005 [Halobacteriales archaeon QH_6_64_20]